MIPSFLFRIFQASVAILPRRVMMRTKNEDFEKKKKKKKTNRREREKENKGQRVC